MTTMILKTAGSVAGGAIGGPLGAAIGASLGQVAATALSPTSKLPRVQGARLNDLSVQTSTYGKMIPILFGTARLAGNIIWSRPIKETANTTRASSGGGKGAGGGGRSSQSVTNYTYSVSLAIGVCEGEITDILRVWADAKPLDLSQGTYRLYRGSETQLADPFIESFEGIGSTPAYRGLSYVVIEDLPLAAYGNRIPNFTFEVKRKALSTDVGGVALEHAITAVTLIPGSGEFVYDTIPEFKRAGSYAGGRFAQVGPRLSLNQHTPYGKANVLVALDQLKETLPNVEWINVVVNWFGTNLDAGSCTVLPGVEYASGGITEPDSWAVAGRIRGTAHLIGSDSGKLRYGGTPDDDSLIRLLTELRTRGYKILLTPMFVMDVAGKPWRGQVTGSATNVISFFTKTNGYNAFVTHYATLCANKIDAFAIGSELVGLTKVSSSAGVYPAVTALVSLAATVRGLLASGTKITYAADWSEYHHTDGGWYNLDPLWASANIDVIGIDAYFPLADAPQSGYDLAAATAGWTEGEGYEWYYSDSGRTVQAALSPAYAWKNIAWWWSHSHVNPNSVTTGWVPCSKPIWFTEFGFPSVDGALNQPNVFYDPTTSASAFPYHSRGRIDIRAQRLGLACTEAQWAGSSMVQKRFAWTWDARPYPYWPDLTSVWGDGASWSRGHWLQGKMGLSSLCAVVEQLCFRTGLMPAQIDASALDARIDGYVISSQQHARACIEELMAAYFFDAVEEGRTIRFVPRGNASLLTIEESDLIVNDEKQNALRLIRAQEMELPQRLYLVYLNRERDYQPGTQIAQRTATHSEEANTLNLPLVLPDAIAKEIAEVTLYTQWISRNILEFDLSTRHAALSPADVVTLNARGRSHRLRITSVQGQYPGRLRIRAVEEDVAVYEFSAPPGSGTAANVPQDLPVPTALELLDLPSFPQDAPDAAPLRIAAAGGSVNWKGCLLYRSEDHGDNYAAVASADAPDIIGTALTALPSGPTASFDRKNTVDVAVLPGGELTSAAELAVLNGANSAVLGGEIIQFMTAALIAQNTYRLSGLLRARLGTDHAVAGHAAGDRFVMLDAGIASIQAQSVIGLPRLYKAVTFGSTLAEAETLEFIYTGNALKPLSPVQVRGSRDGSGNLTISWVRRTRGGGDWRDYVDVPLNEASEAYDVEVMNGASVIRTFSSLTNPVASYTAAQQIADFGSTQSSVTVKIYQRSARVGRGWPGVAIV